MFFQNPVRHPQFVNLSFNDDNIIYELYPVNWNPVLQNEHQVKQQYWSKQENEYNVKAIVSIAKT
jgi:hypothetical protein